MNQFDDLNSQGFDAGSGLSLDSSTSSVFNQMGTAGLTDNVNWAYDGSTGGRRMLQGFSWENTTSDQYLKVAHMISDYIKLVGMFEITDKDSYKAYGGINQNQFEWKHYNSRLTTNKFGLQEIKFNLSDVTLLGSSGSIDPINEVINRFQVRLDKDKLDSHSYYYCKVSQDCPFHQYLNVSDADLYQSLIEYFYRDYADRN